MTIKYAKHNIFQQHAEEKELQQKLDNILCKDTVQQDDHIRASEIKNKLTDINDRQTKGMMVRSRARWTELGGKTLNIF